MDETAPLLSVQTASESFSTDVSPSTAVEKDGELPKRSGTLISSTLALVNTTMGIGILALPYAAASGGLAVGLALLFVVGVSTNITHRFLISCADRTGEYSLRGVTRQAFGSLVAAAVELVVMAYALGSCIAFCVILGSVTAEVMEHWVPSSSIFAQRWFCIPLLMACVMFPLSSLRSLHGLRFASFLALGALLYLLAVVIERFFALYRAQGADIQLANVDLRLLIAIPLITVSFCSQYNVLPIYGELRERSAANMAIVVNFSTLICFTTYVAFAAFGYLSFGANICSDILDNYPTGDNLALSGRILQGVVLCLCYPIVFFALRSGVLGFIVTTEQRRSLWWIVPVAVLGSVVHAVVGIFVNDLGTVLSFSGAIFGGSIAFVFPCAIFLKLRRDLHLLHPARGLALVVLLLGLAFIALGTTQAVRRTFFND